MADIVFCSSVIEHVSIDEKTSWEIYSGKKFSKKAFERQRKFAKEIARVGKKYFVQTPNKYFPYDPHMRLPLINYLPRPVLLLILKFIKKYRLFRRSRMSRYIPTCNLLGNKEMKNLFPDSIIIKEKYIFIVKSLIAVRNAA